MKRLGVVSASLVLLLGCGGYVKPEVVPTGQNTYMLQATSQVVGWGDLGEMKAAVYREATAFAESKGKVIVPISTNEANTAWGKKAFFELKFKLAEKDSPEALNVHMVPSPNVVIEKREQVTADIKTKDTSEKKSDMYAELLKLDDLRKRGILTDAEFEAQKKKILEGK